MTYKAMGVADVNDGKPYHPDYDKWPIAAQLEYELGRLSAVKRTPRERKKS